MKVFVQIVNTMTGILNSGMIEEPVKKGLEVDNALKHFGVAYGEVEWEKPIVKSDIVNSPIIKIGNVKGTAKVITVITYGG